MIDISVIIPVYNVDKYIKSTIKSLIKQTYKNIEIIIINDNSTDSTLEICNMYAKLDSRIKVFNQPYNCGAARARNRGLSIAKGKYIFFMDSDDYIDLNMLENLFNKAEEEEVDLIICGYYFETIKQLNDKTKVLSKFSKSFKSKKYNNKEELMEDYIKLWDNAMLYNIWNKLYKKDIIDKNNILFKDLLISEDIEFNKEYIKICNKVYIDERCYYHYIREREGSITTKYKENLFRMRVEENEEFIRYFKELGIYNYEAREYVSRRYIERVVGCIENLFHSNKEVVEIYKSIKEIVNHTYTREAISNANIKTKKMKLLLLPIKIKSTVLTMSLIKLISIIRKTTPFIFEKFKQTR